MDLNPTFESLRVWQGARRLTCDLYEITGQQSFRDRSLRDQMRRAAISVTSNIAEGCERGGSREFVQFLKFAKGSIAEIRSQLYAAEDLKYLSPEVARSMRKQAVTISREIASLIEYRMKD